MRTTTIRPATGKKTTAQKPPSKTNHNLSEHVATSLEQARLQEQKEEQERPEKQLADLSERSVVDIAVTLEDIARGNSGRKDTTKESKAAARGSGSNENESNYRRPADNESYESSGNNALKKDIVATPERESDVIKYTHTEVERAPTKYIPTSQASNLANDKVPAGKQGKKEKKRNSRADSQTKAFTGSATGKRKVKKDNKQERAVEQDQQTRRKNSINLIPVATKAVEYAAEFNKETEEIARRIRQARNKANAARQAGKAATTVVKKAAQGIAWLTRVAIAAIRGLITALMIGGAAVIPIVIIIAVIAAVISSPFSLFAGADISDDENQSGTSPAVAINLPETVLRYKHIVEAECAARGIPQYVDVILAIMMQESGGRVPDVMQSSASAGLPNNTLQPEESIKQGIKYFKTILDSADSRGIDFDTCLQSYNYGIGFVGYVEQRGKSYTYELANQFSNEKAAELGVARYGDKNYVPNVYRYLQGTGSVVLSDNPIGRHLNSLYAELYSKIGAESANLQGAELSEVIFANSEGDSTSNAVEILAVFSVRATIGAGEQDSYTLAEIGDEQLQVLTTVFWDMHSIETSTGHKAVTETDDEGNEIQKTVLVKTITVSVKSTEDMAAQYGFDDSAKGAMDEMLTDYRGELLAFVSVAPSGTDLSTAEIAAIIRDLPAGDKGAAIVKIAFTRLGDPYDQKRRFTGRYIDCSGLTMWSYAQMGITIPGTAAEQGRFCVNKNVIVSRDALVAGDLVFYSDKTNGRFMNITHVAIYVGDGMIIDASSNRGKVVYRKLWGRPIMFARPHIL